VKYWNLVSFPKVGNYPGFEGGALDTCEFHAFPEPELTFPLASFARFEFVPGHTIQDQSVEVAGQVVGIQHNRIAFEPPA
jgi:hypothetical protein